MTFDDFSAGSGSTKETPDSNTEEDNFEAHSDETLKILLNQLGATSNDVKEYEIDLDLTKP